MPSRLVSKKSDLAQASSFLVMKDTDCRSFHCHPIYSNLDQIRKFGCLFCGWSLWSCFYVRLLVSIRPMMSCLLNYAVQVLRVSFCGQLSFLVGTLNHNGLTIQPDIILFYMSILSLSFTFLVSDVHFNKHFVYREKQLQTSREKGQILHIGAVLFLLFSMTGPCIMY